MLSSYERYLRKERTITRKNQFGAPLTRRVKGMGDAGIYNHMRDLRILFKAVFSTGPSKKRFNWLLDHQIKVNNI